MSSITENNPFARLLARSAIGTELAERLRRTAAVDVVPTDAEIDAAAEHDYEAAASELAQAAIGELASANRRARRAVRAQDRRDAAAKATPPPPAPSGKAHRERERAERARAKLERASDRRYREGLERRSVDWAEPPTKRDSKGREWRTIPQRIWTMCKDIVSDTSGKAWRYWARQVRNKTALGAIRRAALLPSADGRTTRRSWADETARRMAALGLALVHLAKHTSRKGPFCLIVRGVSLTALCWLLGYPVSSTIKGDVARAAAAKVPHYNTLIGRHRGTSSDRERGTLGYLRCLEETGLIAQTQQAYTDPAPWEQSDVIVRPGMQPRRFNMNRYWVVGDASTTRNAKRKPELIELNQEGWRSLDERPRRHRERVLYTGKPREIGAPAAPS